MAVDASQRQSFTGVALTRDSFIGQITVANGAPNGVDLISLIKTNVAKMPIAVDLMVYPTAGEPSIVVELRTAVANPGFPLPHIPAGGGAHPTPLRINFSDLVSVFLCENAGGINDANVAIIAYY